MSNSLRQAKDVAIESFKDAKDDNLLHWAAAMAFYAALSFAPLLLVVMVVTSFFTDVGWAADRLSTVLGNFLPDESEGRMRDFVENAVQSRNRIGFFSAIAFLYSGSRVFASMTRALHVIYDNEDEGDLFRELLVQLVMLLTIGVAFLFALSSRFIFGLFADAIGFLPSGEEQAVQRITSGLIQIILLFGAFVLIYRFVPGREEAWRPPLTGAAVATALFVIVRPIFIFYLDRFGNQEVVYGSLASLAVLLIWIWIGAIITLFGGEVADNTRQANYASN